MEFLLIMFEMIGVVCVMFPLGCFADYIQIHIQIIGISINHLQLVAIFKDEEVILNILKFKFIFISL